jgi:hypothetical protein
MTYDCQEHPLLGLLHSSSCKFLHLVSNYLLTYYCTGMCPDFGQEQGQVSQGVLWLLVQHPRSRIFGAVNPL